MDVYRITLAKWADKLAASGMAARWNSEGNEVIYTDSSRALACLENLVHRKNLGSNDVFRTMIIHIPKSVKPKIIQLTDLNDGWNEANEEGYKICQNIGDAWLSENSSVLLSVPSAIIKDERNFLINTYHPDFSTIKIKGIEPFFFDPRLITTKK